MAEDNIDKVLPNEPRKEFNVPGEEELQETLVEEVREEQQSPDDVELQSKSTVFELPVNCQVPV